MSSYNIDSNSNCGHSCKKHVVKDIEILDDNINFNLNKENINDNKENNTNEANKANKPNNDNNNDNIDNNDNNDDLLIEPSKNTKKKENKYKIMNKLLESNLFIQVKFIFYRYLNSPFFYLSLTRVVCIIWIVFFQNIFSILILFW